MRTLPQLAALFALAPFASTQDPADEVALALLRRDPAAAARAAAHAATPAQRARLQAALLPDSQRVGDVFALPLAIDRAGDTAGPDDAVVTATAVAEGLTIERARTELTVPAGRVVSTAVPMRAVAAGEATLQLGGELGTFADRSQRTISIAPDRVARTLFAAAAGTGEVTVALPAGASADAPITVDVLQGGTAAWQRIEADLLGYPYGCAEQTLSRLLPRSAWLRVAMRRFEPRPPLEVELGKRLRAGLAHLHTLQPTSSRQFAFWPDQQPEPGITGLVLHGLAVLRDGGFDLARSGLDLPTYAFDDPLPKRDGIYVVDETFVRAAEMLAGAVRLFPTEERARQQLRPALELVQALPAGLCARMGLALHGAGDVDGARVCRQRLQDGALPALRPDGFPGEDPLAVQALRLELDAALGAPADGLQRDAAGLLLACLAGRGTTYGHACALTVLAKLLPYTTPKQGTIVVEAGGERRELAFGSETPPSGTRGGPPAPRLASALRVRLPHAARVTVRGPADMQLLVRVATERSERASDHAAWAKPVRIERQWYHARPDATWQQRRDGEDLEPHRGPILVGRPLVLRLTVTSPVPMRHVVVDCPLPAGFELPQADARIERFDDRVAFTCDLEPGVPVVLRLDVVPTVTGRLLWPPATAAPMYVADSDGGTTGGFVEVAAVPPGGLPSFAPCLQGPPPERVEAEPDALAEWCVAIERACDASHEPELDEAQRAQLVAARWATLPPPDEDLPWRLRQLTELLHGIEPAEDDGRFRERTWRIATHARLQGIVTELASAVLAAPWPVEPDAANERAEELGRALAACAPSAAHEALLVQWWQRARPLDRFAETLVDLAPYSPTHPGLRDALRAIAATTKGEPFTHVWKRLAPDDRAALSPSLVLDAAPPEAAGVIAALAEHEGGRAELRRRLALPGFARTHFDRLEAELPMALWAEAPLATFADLATAAVGDEPDVPIDAVLRHLAASAFPVEALQRQLATTKVPAWRFVLAQALRARIAPAGDGAPTMWAQALALAPTDVAGAQTLLAAAKAAEPGPDLAGERALLTDFVAPVLVGHASPAQLYAAREHLDADHWRAAWQRLPSADRVRLLGHFQKHVDDTFVPANADEAAALWQFVQRSGDVDDPIAAMLQSPAGTDCVRRHLLAGEAGALDAAIREAYANALAVDAQTLAPHPDEELPALLARLERHGFVGPFTPDEAARLRRLRLQRGL